MNLQPIQLSPAMREFLTLRAGAGGSDNVVCSTILGRAVDRDNLDAQDYFDIRDSDGAGRISYTTRNRLLKAGIAPHNDEVYHPGGHRIIARAGTVAQRLSGIRDGDAIGAFSAAVTGYFHPGTLPRIVDGDAIPFWYSSKNHCLCLGANHHWKGGIASSCMSNERNPKVRFAFYVDHAKMAIALCKDCGLLRTRCIIWPDADGGGAFDRIYGENPEGLRSFLRESGYLPYGGNGGKVKLPEGADPLKRYASYPALDSLRAYCKTCHTLFVSGYGYEGCAKENHEFYYASYSGGFKRGGGSW